jgi:hypothetical protein
LRWGREAGKRPTESEVFDTLHRNPHRGTFDLYTKVWPVLVASLLVFAVVFPRQFAGITGAPEQYGSAHTCWVNSARDISGCRMDDGSIEGLTTSIQTTCFFDEPLPAGDVQVHCR